MTQELLAPSLPLTPDFSPYPTGEEWLAQYIFGSFYFSQGSVALQEDIDSLTIGVIATSEQRQWITDSSINTVLTLARDAITSYFARGNHHFGKSTSASRLVINRITNIELIAHSPKSKVKYGLLYEVLGGFASRDEKFLGVAPREGELDENNGHRTIPSNSRYGTSLLLSYLVDKKDAQHPLFSTMFEQMRKLDFDAETVRRMQAIEASIAAMKKRDVRDIGALVLSFKDGHE